MLTWCLRLCKNATLCLKITNVRLEAVRGSHLDGEEVMVVLLELRAGGVLSEEQLGKILEAVD